MLARLGLERYAFICRSAITEVVNAAYLQSEQVGFRAFRRAMDGSGIEPPDLEDFSWGGLMGIEEASARDRVAGALEAAVASASWQSEGVAGDLTSAGSPLPPWISPILRVRA